MAAVEQSGTEAVFALDREVVMGTYLRQPILFVRGEGAYLWDSNGEKYLDFLAGIAVVQAGHCHPHIANAIAKQAHTLMHISNLFHNPLQAELAQKLCRLTEMQKAFFCNSGCEANECALKIARKWGKAKRGADCFEIITFHGSFHGRTMATVTATAQPKYQAPFQPLIPGFHYTSPNDIEALRALVSSRTCAVMLEPIQGEGGIRPMQPNFLQQVRALCDATQTLLILDEIQCGTGRTGSFLGSQSMGIKGDVITLAKGIADGFPMGVCLAQGEAANTLVPGDHGSTFAGQPLACAAALATLEVIEQENLIQNARETGGWFLAALQKLQTEYPDRIAEVRGMGLMVGVELKNPEAKSLLQGFLRNHIVVNATSDTVLRFVPPLIVTQQECEKVVSTLKTLLQATA